jgi:hypothetical protein
MLKIYNQKRIKFIIPSPTAKRIPIEVLISRPLNLKKIEENSSDSGLTNLSKSYHSSSRFNSLTPLRFENKVPDNVHGISNPLEDYNGKI